MSLPTRSFSHFTGDATGLMAPAHGDALLQGGAEWLTIAFRSFGALAADNSVVRITRFEACSGGSTGQKFFLTAEYAKPSANLHNNLFVKFSRDFADERRDWQRTEMESESRLAVLSRRPGFPIAVPTAYFADYAAATGTGLIITQSVAFGDGAIEPHRRKCLDHQTMERPLEYYRAVVTALARLAGSHRGGRLATDIEARFPFAPVSGSADPIGYDDAELSDELDRCFAFAKACPQLLPAEVCNAEFHAQMQRDVWEIRINEAAIQRYLTSNPDMIALCHWNAHIDNCFFWRDAAQGLHCGFIDWGRVGQLTFGSILWGGLSAAHHDIWDHHLHELLELFVSEYHTNGGPLIELEELELHLALHMATMGVARVLAFPEIIQFRQPLCAKANGPQDPMFLPAAMDGARNCLHVYTNFLQHWRRQDFGAKLKQLLARQSPRIS